MQIRSAGKQRLIITLPKTAPKLISTDPAAKSAWINVTISRGMRDLKKAVGRGGGGGGGGGVELKKKKKMMKGLGFC